MTSDRKVTGLPPDRARLHTYSAAGIAGDPSLPNPLSPARREREETRRAACSPLSSSLSPLRAGEGTGVGFFARAPYRLDVARVGAYNGGAWAPACLKYLAQRTKYWIRSVRFAGG